MNREQWRSAYRAARLRRRRDWWPAAESRDLIAEAFKAHSRALVRAGRTGAGVRLLGRRTAVWAFTVLALLAATLAFWRTSPDESRDAVVQVDVPAASAPALAAQARGQAQVAS